MRYDTYRYLYPPRPERKIAPTNLAQVEALGWWAQTKMNGTCVTLYVSPDNTSVAMGRHGPDNRTEWQPGARWDSFARAFSFCTGWYVFVGELLHSKVKGGPRDTVYLFDVLVSDSNYLVGKTLRERYNLLNALCGFIGENQTTDYREVSEGVWLASNRRKDFGKLFDAAGGPEVEGLVFKNPDARLQLCSRASNNSDWQMKCRYAKANLSF